MPFFTQYMADCGTRRILLVSYVFVGFKKQLDVFGEGKTHHELLLPSVLFFTPAFGCGQK